jgi:RNA polymerase sigma-70 factor (ECF subfamily)
VAEGKLNALRLRIPFVSRQQRGRSGPPPALGGDLDSPLGAVARGEHGAFDLVYERLREPVYRQVATVLRDLAQSEEVTQEVFLELWSTAEQYDPIKGSAAGWAR